MARRRLGYDLSRWGGLIPYPVESVAGPLVTLTNEHAGSDGDIFCHSFKLMKLGPLIGKRTWGGVVGIRMDKPFIDGGMMTIPEFAWWEAEGGWTMENYGVDPDIEVENMPGDVIRGRDAQLEKGIQVLLGELKRDPKTQPHIPAFPDKSKKK